MPLRLDSAAAGFEAGFDAFLGGKREASADVDAAVAEIVAAVRAGGDAALIAYTERFDRLALTPETLRIPQADLDAAAGACAPETIQALELAAERITDYHRRQKPEDLD
jgi:histidinol dehydrogenase